MKLDYLRISVTDRCNLNCIYCRPRERVTLLDRDKLLSLEEIVEFVTLMIPWGLEKVRLTGGEPLLRKDIVKLISMIAGIDGIKDITLTTNGTVLEGWASGLKNASLDRINISLDTLNKERFVQITGYDGLPNVLRGIKAARDAGLEPVKINVVVLRGINDAEIVDFVAFAQENSLVLRFIEYMNINKVGLRRWYIPNKVVKNAIEKIWGRLEPTSFTGSGPAEYFTLKRASLAIGFISPVSKSFCHHCSKLRLSADGKLKPCLAEDSEIDVKRILRSKDAHRQIEPLIKAVIAYKKQRRASHPNFDNSGRFMFQIGG